MKELKKLNFEAQRQKGKKAQRKSSSILVLLCVLCVSVVKAQVPQDVMQNIYNEVKTPFKYGLVVTPDNDAKKIDCPSVFRKGNAWFMTYIQFDGRGYETWIARSNDLLHWKTLGRIMSFSDTTDWDNNQKAGYISLQNTQWEGNYQLEKFHNK